MSDNLKEDPISKSTRMMKLLSLQQVRIIYKKLVSVLLYYIYIIHITIVGIMGLLSDKWNSRNNKYNDFPQMTGRVALVTGGSRGIGLQIVRKLLLCDLEVIVACRNCIAAKEAIRELRVAGVKSGTARAMELDNASIKSIHSFANKFREQYRRLDILVNNVGTFWLDNYTETQDGFEYQYQMNYLSHFLLTHLLIPPLKAAGNGEQCARVINMNSVVYKMSNINFGDINYKKDPTRHYLGYSESKLALLLFTKTFARLACIKNLPIKMNAVNPGVANSDLFNNWNISPLKIFKRIFYTSAADGATSVIFAAVSPNIEKKTGLYIENCKDVTVKPYVLNLSVQMRLHNLTLKQLDMTDFFENEY